MFDFRAAASSLWSALRKNTVATAVILFVVVLVLATPVLVIYRLVRANVPGASILPEK